MSESECDAAEPPEPERPSGRVAFAGKLRPWENFATSPNLHFSSTRARERLLAYTAPHGSRAAERWPELNTRTLLLSV